MTSALGQEETCELVKLLNRRPVLASGRRDFDRRVENDVVAAIPADPEIENLLVVVGNHASYLTNRCVEGHIQKARGLQVGGQNPERLSHLAQTALSHALKNGNDHLGIEIVCCTPVTAVGQEYVKNAIGFTLAVMDAPHVSI